MHMLIPRLKGQNQMDHSQLLVNHEQWRTLAIQQEAEIKRLWAALQRLVLDYEDETGEKAVAARDVLEHTPIVYKTEINCLNSD